MATLIVMVGPPGSGKTTWIKEYISKHLDFKVVNTDNMRKEILGNTNDQSKNAEIWAEAHRRVKNYLLDGKNVILDALNTTERDRRRLNDYLKDVSHKIYYKIMKLENLETLHGRIKKDIESGKDRSNVPPDVIERNISNFKMDIDKIKKEQIFRE